MNTLLQTLRALKMSGIVTGVACSHERYPRRVPLDALAREQKRRVRRLELVRR